MSIRRTTWICTLIATSALASLARAQTSPSAREVVEQVGFDQKLDAALPLDLTFRDESGETVKLRDYFGARPVVLTLVYYECPMLCTQILNGLTRAMRAMRLEVGRDYDIVTVTIDPGEGPELARDKKRRYLDEYGVPEAASGWHFLSPVEDAAAASDAIARLCDSVGFRFAYYPEIDQYAHASGFVTATPDGRVSKYFYGVEYAPRDLRLALVESSEGRIGSFVDQVLLLCYHYDPTSGKYGLAIMSAVRVLGIATALALAVYIVRMLRRDRAALRTGEA